MTSFSMLCVNEPLLLRRPPFLPPHLWFVKNASFHCQLYVSSRFGQSVNFFQCPFKIIFLFDSKIKALDKSEWMTLLAEHIENFFHNFLDMCPQNCYQLTLWWRSKTVSICINFHDATWETGMHVSYLTLMWNTRFLFVKDALVQFSVRAREEKMDRLPFFHCLQGRKKNF